MLVALGAAEKSVLSCLRLAVIKRKSRKTKQKERESIALDWKLGTKVSGDQNPLHVILYCLFLSFYF